MKLVSLLKPVFPVILLACAGCGTEDPAAAAPGAAPGANQADTNEYGYEFANDSASEISPPGKLAPEVIQTAVRARFGDMRGCYEAALQQTPDIAGRVEAKFEIHEDGSVTNVQNGASTLPNPATVQCVLDVIAGTTFPTSTGGTVTVVYPIMFSPGEDE